MHLRPLILLGIVISMVTGVAGGLSLFMWRQNHLQQVLDAKTVSEVAAHIRKNYVVQVSDEELFTDALHGMIAGLDPHSRYLDRDDLDELRVETSGEFGGIGVEINLEDGFFTVVSPIDNTSAQRNGIQAGDRIIEIDHASLKGARLREVVRNLRGEPGTEVHVRIARSGIEAFDVYLERSKIEIPSVAMRWLEPGIAYARISSFQSSTGVDFVQALNDLITQQAVTGLVLDLRNNPGGILDESVAVADALLDEGMIVSTKGRLPSTETQYRADNIDLLNGSPVVVLINEGSASAAEVVAGALKDHGRATLLGTTTYGKGSVQRVLRLSNDAALKLTTAYYFTPNGLSIHESGIQAHQPLPVTDDEGRVLAEAVLVLRNIGEERLRAQLDP
ncbi:MAG: S41 family peptidase [Proteobacteria bacterium]|nr:S41 family peptidase [Pseudomonadota bacterium]